MSSTNVTYEGKTFSIRNGETLLEGLEREGQYVPSSCRAGACHFCMLKVVKGKVPSISQQGLKPQLKDSGHFLSCLCKPDTEIECVPAHSADFQGHAEIESITHIGPDIVRVRFHRPATFQFIPGQFVTFTQDKNISRSYSIASLCNEMTYFDIHVRLIPQGRMSTWLHKNAQPGDSLWMEGPKGECTYYAGNPGEPITLIGTGTGIAPLYAIALDALAQRHEGPITFYQGALSESQLYFEQELTELSKEYPQIRYVRCVVNKPTRKDITYGDLKDIALSELTDVDIRRVYMCGDPGIVRRLKKTFFLAGVSIKRLHADPFVITERHAK